MSSRNFYRRVTIAGLRSNPKLCVVKPDHGDAIITCGFPCECYVIVSVQDGFKYDEAVRAGKLAVIKKHDQWMKTAKRNRIRASNPRTESLRPLQIRRSTWRVGESILTPSSLVNINFTS